MKTIVLFVSHAGSRKLSSDTRGAAAIEYALIASGIGAAIAATVWSFGTSLAQIYQRVADIL
jgi:Flp pilus assembly pilin Flp